MAEQANLTLPTYKQAQQTLFGQILNAIRIAVASLLALGLVALIIPALQTLAIALIIGVLLAEWGAAELGRWFMRRGRIREGAISYVILTLILAAVAGIVMRFPGFTALVTMLLIAISALLIGPRYGIAPGVLGTLFFMLVEIADLQGWLAGIQLPQTFGVIIPIQIVFVAAALGVMIAVSLLTSDRLQRNAHDAQARAEDAERARTVQVALNEQLGAQIEEQRHLLIVIQELETPIIPILSGVLVLPLVGHLDSRRIGEIGRRLLERVAADHTELVLIDITGVPLVDTAIANGISGLGQAARLLGAQIILTGLRPATAQTLAGLGTDLSFAKTYATIQDALAQVEFNRDRRD
jgi:anti-anti-sigma regulatory factor